MAHSFAELPERGAWRLTGAHEGFEVVRFRVERDGIVLAGTSVGTEDGVPWDLRYVIELESSWRTRRAVIEAGDGRRMEIAKDAASWIIDGTYDLSLDGCVDLDLEGSVVTNTVPVHRLALAVAERTSARACECWARADRAAALTDGLRGTSTDLKRRVLVRRQAEARQVNAIATSADSRRRVST